MSNQWTAHRRVLAASVALASASIALITLESGTVSAVDDDCIVVNPSRTEFDRSPSTAYRLDGSAVGQLPLSRAVTSDGMYADFRASTDTSVPNYIVVGDLETGNEEVVFELSRDATADKYTRGLQFSPNGEFLSFGVLEPGSSGFRTHLRVIDLDGNVVLAPEFQVRPEDARFSPDSSKIVYSDDTFSLGRDVWVAATDGSTPPVRILDAPPDFVIGPHDVPQNAGDFSWAPDSTRFAFEGRNGLTAPPFFAASFEVYYANADGSNVTQLPSVIIDGSETSQTNPAWSPDGKSIAFFQAEDGALENDDYSLVRHDLGTNAVTPISGTSGVFPVPQGLDMVWTSADEITFNGSRNLFDFDNVEHGVFAVPASGGQSRLIVETDATLGQPFSLDLIAGLMSCDAIPAVAYAGVVPDRIMDTRGGVGVRAGVVGDGETVTLQVGGAGGVPTVGADAVALNVTVARTSASSFLSVFPHGVDRPTTSNLNWNPNQTKASTVIVKLGDDGRIDFYNDDGEVHIIADVAGWFSAGSGFTAVSPERILDTRRPTGVDVAGRLDRGTLTLPVHGRLVPDTATGVVMNVTAPAVSEQSFLSVYPSGGTDPGTSNLNLFPGVTSANVVFSQIGADGGVSISNPDGASHVVADVAGYLEPSSGFEGGEPTRLVDTRRVGPLRGGSVLNVPLRGVEDGVPDSARVAILNVTALRGTRRSFLTVYPGDARPNASNVNFDRGNVVPNLVIAAIGADGSINIYNDDGDVDVLVDVLGWFN